MATRKKLNTTLCRLSIHAYSAYIGNENGIQQYSYGMERNIRFLFFCCRYFRELVAATNGRNETERNGKITIRAAHGTKTGNTYGMWNVTQRPTFFFFALLPPAADFFCAFRLQHVCLKGRMDFKMAMQREAQVVKDCLTFSGPPDPLRGEEIYRK